MDKINKDILIVILIVLVISAVAVIALAYFNSIGTITIGVVLVVALNLFKTYIKAINKN